jgi:hypothetical protein
VVVGVCVWVGMCVYRGCGCEWVRVSVCRCVGGRIFGGGCVFVVVLCVWVFLCVYLWVGAWVCVGWCLWVCM